jgi:hypothetical protein
LMSDPNLVKGDEGDALKRDVYRSVAALHTIATAPVRKKAQELLLAVSSRRSDQWGQRWTLRTQFQEAVAQELGIDVQENED